MEKSPNIFFPSVMDADDEFLDKALEGVALFALNQGEVCTCPSRLLIHESIYDKFIEKVLARVAAIKTGNPFDPTVMMGAQASKIQKDKILSYINLGKEEGAELLCGGDVNHLGGDLRTPTLAEDLAIGCWLAAKKRATGIYHVSGAEMMTPYDIALQTADFFGLKKSLIHETNSNAFRQPARRPLKTGFIIEKAKRELGYQPRTFREGLAVIAGQLGAA